MTRLKDITYESGSLTGINGADSSTGTGIAIDSNSVIKGTYCARCNVAANTGYSQEDYTLTDTVYVSMYLRVATGPSTNATIIEIRNQISGVVAKLRIRDTTKLITLTDGANTQIGSGFTYANNTTYRLGIRYTKGTGANGIIQFYAVAGDAAFGSAIASTSTDIQTLQTDRIRVGSPQSSITMDIYIDNIRVDDTAMPTDDVSSTTYNQSVNITQGTTITRAVLASKSMACSVGTTATQSRLATKPLSTTINSVVTRAQITTKSLSMTISNTVLLSRITAKIVSVNIVVLATLLKMITFYLAIVENINVAFINSIIKTVDIIQSNVVAISKRVDSIIDVISVIDTAISKYISTALSAIVSISASISKQVYTRINTSNTIGLTVSRQIAKIIPVTVSIVVSIVSTIVSTVITFIRNTGTLQLNRAKSGTIDLPRSNDGSITYRGKDSGEL